VKIPARSNHYIQGISCIKEVTVVISYEEEEKEEKEFREKYGHVLSYTNKRCINCGRMRVELWSSGKRICEKCHMNQDTKEYEPVKY
jgi:hypothetical protein